MAGLFCVCKCEDNTVSLPSFLYARWASHKSYVIRSCRSKEKKKAWRLTLLVSVNTMTVSKPALRQLPPYCWCSGCHSKGVSTDKWTNVWMQSWVGYFAVDRVKAPLLPITSHSWRHTGCRAGPGTAAWICLEGADRDHHLWLHSKHAVCPFPEQRWEAFTVSFANIMFPFSLSQRTDIRMTALCSTGLFFLRQ